MRLKSRLFWSICSLAWLSMIAPSQAQINLGDYTISGSGEVGGMFSHRSGNVTKLEEYRDLPETLVVPQLELFLDSKKNDFYLEMGTLKTGLNDQSYRLRAGRYGLLDLEFVWDQIPHLFNVDSARTPYNMDDGNYTLSSKPSGTTGANMRDWVNANARPVDLKLYNGLAKFNLRYTPTPGWTFTGSYGSQNTAGKRAFGGYFGPSPGNYNITELAEPIDYQTHNIELGGEYAGKGWSLGLITRLFFCKPATILSMASSKSLASTAFLPWRAARSAASLTMFARSAPTKPGVLAAITLKSTAGESFIFLACSWRIFSRPLTSGRSTSTWRSKRPGRSSAGSSISGRLVAAIKITPLLESKPSISASN